MTEVQHLSKFWPVPVGLRDPRLLATPRKQVEHDLPDSKPASSPNELGCGRTAPVRILHFGQFDLGQSVFIRLRPLPELGQFELGQFDLGPVYPS